MKVHEYTCCLINYSYSPLLEVPMSKYGQPKMVRTKIVQSH